VVEPALKNVIYFFEYGVIMAQGHKPDFICIGAQKAGTTWLYVTLGRRPDIWFPPFKEFHFFDTTFDEHCRR
jgi:hypothetical protein